VAEIFDSAIALPAAEIDPFLVAATGGNSALLAEVRSLLSSHGEAGDFLDPQSSSLRIPLTPSLLSAMDSAPLFTQFAPETLIGNRYRVQSLLGQGGVGEVYAAWDEELGIPVALKTLRCDFGMDALRSLKQEAMMARAVVHPNVCRVYDLGCHGDPKSGTWFLTMEVLRGTTLAERLQAQGRFTAEQARPLVEQMASGLDAAHQAGVVHLDFKSGNVMLVGGAGDEQAVITDFGLARTTRQRSDDARDGTEFLGLAGTPAYMAPEQLAGEAAGPAADIYALGIVLFEMMTGVRPFAEGMDPVAIQQRLEVDAPSPRSIVPDLDDRWEAVIRRCLERNPHRRFDRAGHIAEALAGRLSVQLDMPEGTLPIQHSLPAERDRFVGRDDLLAQLARMMSSTRLITLLGAGGLGKTRLAVRYGWRTLADWPGGVWFCDLTEARDLNGIASAMGQTFGVPFVQGDPIVQVGLVLAGRGRCLVILDNVEQVLNEATGTIQRWLEQAPEVQILVTSRERLNLRSESILELVPMDSASGLELFIERARGLRPGLELDDAELAAAREIVRLVEGIPLAIELAGARMRVMSAAQIMAAMRKRFSLLTGGPSERHETLTAAIDGSWDLLTPWEKAAFAQCSTFEGGFTLAAAEAVLDLSVYATSPWTVDVVQSLVDKSLLRTSVQEQTTSVRRSEPRCVMYVSLQEYARGKLAASGAIPGGGSGTEALRAAEERHARWFGGFGAPEAMAALNRHGGLQKRQALGKELDNLLAASRRSATGGDGATAAAAYAAAWETMVTRGPLGALVELGQEILATQPGDEERASVLMTLGEAERESGQTPQARTHFEAALAIYRERGDRAREAHALVNLGTVHRIQGRVQEARAHNEEALAIHRSVQDRFLESLVLRELGGLDQEQGGRMGEARKHLEGALSIAREMGNQRMEAVLLGNLANVDLQEGKVVEAQGRYEAGLALAREMSDRRNEGVVLGNLGALLCQLGRGAEGRRNLEAEGRRHLETALAIHREVGSRRSEGIILGRIATTDLQNARLEEAGASFEAAIAIHREVGNQRWEGTALVNLGSVYYNQGRIAEARDALARGEAVLRAVKALIEIPKVLCVRADLEHEVGNLSLARDLLREAEELAAQTGSERNPEIAHILAGVRQKLA
jgi:predicted ATPase/serine/threonine protein kinase/Tfp pilus assembly protein PilF